MQQISQNWLNYKVFHPDSYLKLLGLACVSVVIFLIYIGIRGAPPKDLTEIMIFIIMIGFFMIAAVLSLLEGYGTQIKLTEDTIESQSVLPWCKGKMDWKEIKTIKWGGFSQDYIFIGPRYSEIRITPHLHNIREFNETIKERLPVEVYSPVIWKFESISKDNWKLREKVENGKAKKNNEKSWLFVAAFLIGGLLLFGSEKNYYLFQSVRYVLCLISLSVWWIMYNSIIYITRRYVPHTVVRVIGTIFVFLGLIFGLSVVPITIIDRYNLRYAGQALFGSNIIIGLDSILAIRLLMKRKFEMP